MIQVLEFLIFIGARFIDNQDVSKIGIRNKAKDSSTKYIDSLSPSNKALSWPDPQITANAKM